MLVYNIGPLVTNTQRAIAFLGAVVPQDMCIQSPACSAGTNKDMLRLIRALGEASGSTLTVFSVQPVGVYPTSRKILVRPGRVDLGHGISCQLVPFVNVLFLKQLTILFGALFYLLAWLWRRRDRQCDVLVHNVYPSMSLPVLLTTKLLGSKSVALVTDLPHDLCFDFRGWRGMLQRLNLFVETHALAHFSGIITYTRFIGEDFSPYRPMLVMEGDVDPGDANPAREAGTADASQSERILLFSGTLSTINGIELLLASFRHLPEAGYRLWIFGRGPLEPLVRETAMEDERVVFFGFVPTQEEVLRRQRKATVLINLRLHDHLINRYTFPGKLREYMLSARPVISTAAPGIPKEYHDYVYILENETPDGLARLLREVCSKPPAELDEFGRRACEFVLRNKNWTVQTQRIYEFIRSL